MRTMTLLFLLALISCSLPADRAMAGELDWKWLIQYSYLQAKDDGGTMSINVQMYDDGRVEDIWSPPLANNAAYWRKLKKTPDEVEDVKRKIEAILAGSKDDEQQTKKAGRTLQAGIIIRTSEELVEAWGDDKYGDPHKQMQKVFRNWRNLSDDTHKKIQELFEQFNKEAEKVPWEWG